jgi:SAM-dependent methyltransferase
MSLDHLHTVRDFEIDEVIASFPKKRRNGEPLRVLDLGAGTGRQSARLSSLGYHVIAVDLKSSAYAKNRDYPIIEYDGKALPLASGCIDVVFSSNVLEHVFNLSELLSETKRVLADNGRAIHILPTSSWRIWTTICHYPWLVLRAVKVFPKRGESASETKSRAPKPASLRWVASGNLWSERHGERGTILTEAWYFSAPWWRRTFSKSGFTLQEDKPIGLFYTGCVLLGERLSVSNRSKLSACLGSSCRVYILKLPKTKG